MSRLVRYKLLHCCPTTCQTFLMIPTSGAVLLVNRAMCQKKKEAWSLVQQDAEAALALDSKLLKVGCLSS